MKKLLATIAILLIMFPAISIADDEEPTTYYVVCRDSIRGVNIRSDCNPSSSREGYCILGDNVEVVKIYRGWAFCIHLGTEAGEGWISADYITKDSITVLEDPEVSYVRGDGRVALRKTIDGKLDHWMYEGEEVHVLGYTDNWTILEEGYMKREFVRIPSIDTPIQEPLNLTIEPD